MAYQNLGYESRALYPGSVSSSGPSNAPPSHPYPEGLLNSGPRQQYLSTQAGGVGPASGPAAGHAAGVGAGVGVPDDAFKKPSLPPKAQQQYAQPPPSNLPYPSISAASPTPIPAAFQPQAQSQQNPNPNPTTSMTASAQPAISSAQSTPTSEAPSQATDASSQVNKVAPLDQERVEALLNVNNLLLQEVQILQKNGLKSFQSGNPQSPQQANQANASSPQTKAEGSDPSPTPNDPSQPATTTGAKPSANSANSTPTTTTPTTTTPTTTVHQQTYNQKKFVEYMKRLQSNIMFLVSMSDASKQRQRAPYPGHLELIPNWLAEGMKEEEKPQFEALKEGYSKLRELWPDWKPGPAGLNPQQQQQQQQQGQAQSQTRNQQPSTQQVQQSQQQPQAISNVAGKF